MDEKSVSVCYDGEGDILEVAWAVTKGYFTPTEDDRVLKRLDLDGNVIGFMIQGLSAMKGGFVDIEMAPELSASTVQNVTVEIAAMELGVTPARVRQLIAAGRVKGAEKKGRDWLVPTPIEMLPGKRGPVGVAGERSGGE